ncbi:uncharacterized protein [Primulina huaijiensis]|uniref:uncharacterized protein isoform X2 n=1 Tax=Primulina huaijiensis TaxID=1492673 RepID=UPI003CC701BA
MGQDREEIEEEEEYVLLDLDSVSADINIPQDAPYVLFGLDTLNPILIIDNKIKLIGVYEETIGTCIIFDESGGDIRNEPFVQQTLNGSQANPS